MELLKEWGRFPISWGSLQELRLQDKEVCLAIAMASSIIHNIYLHYTDEYSDLEVCQLYTDNATNLTRTISQALYHTQSASIRVTMATRKKLGLTHMAETAGEPNQHHKSSSSSKRRGEYNRVLYLEYMFLGPSVLRIMHASHYVHDPHQVPIDSPINNERREQLRLDLPFTELSAAIPYSWKFSSGEPFANVTTCLAWYPSIPMFFNVSREKLGRPDWLCDVMMTCRHYLGDCIQENYQNDYGESPASIRHSKRVRLYSRSWGFNSHGESIILNLNFQIGKIGGTSSSTVIDWVACLFGL